MGNEGSKSIIISIVIITIIFCSQLAYSLDDPIVAAQIHVLPGKNLEEIEVYLVSLKNAGFNSIILRVFHNSSDRLHEIVEGNFDKGSSGVYFRTVLAPTLQDLVTPVSKICRRNKLGLYLWMTTRTMDWLDMETAHDMFYDEISKKLVKSKRFDFFNVNFRDYLFDIFADLAANDVDGIILQDDFVIKTREGFTPNGLEKFKHFSDMEISPENALPSVLNLKLDDLQSQSQRKLFNYWTVFKSDYLLKTGELLIEHIKSINHDLLVGANLYYDAAFSEINGLTWLGQSVSQLKVSSFDLILCMAYHRQVAEEQSISSTEALKKLEEALTRLKKDFSHRFVAKFQSRDWKSGEDLEDSEINAIASIIEKIRGSFAIAPIEKDSKIVLFMNTLVPQKK